MTQSLSTSAIFVSHGAPTIALANNAYTRQLNTIGNELKAAGLRAIVLFSAHYEARELVLSAGDSQYETIYDFGGFPDAMYKIKYPAKGSSQVAQLVRQRLDQHGFKYKVDATNKRGIDHGGWTMLMHMFPKADVPVVQLSLVTSWESSELVRLGTALRGLHREGVLVLCSGVTVHNFDEVDWSQADGMDNPKEITDLSKAPQWAVQFDDWLVDKVGAGGNGTRDLEALAKYSQLAPNVRRAFRTTEHFVPFLIAAGAASDTAKARAFNRSYSLGSFSGMSLRYDEK